MLLVNQLIGFGGLVAPALALTNTRSFRMRGGAIGNGVARSLSVNGNRRKWTYSIWAKLFATEDGSHLHWNVENPEVTANGQMAPIRLDSLGGATFFINDQDDSFNNVSLNWDPTTNPSEGAWAHYLLHWDSDNATENQRVRLWINGTEQTTLGFDTTYPPQGMNSSFTAGILVTEPTLHGIDTDGMLVIGDEIAFFDGQLIDVASVRDTVTGLPKNLTGLNFGTVGFWLRFEGGTAATVGDDYSGLNNDWTDNAHAETVDADMLTDVPGGGTPYSVISMSFVDSNTATASAITIPAAAQAGDIAVLFDLARNSASIPTAVTPASWTQIKTSTGTNARTVYSYRILPGAGGGSITGMNGNLTNDKVMFVLRPDSALTTVSHSFDDVIIATDPSARVASASGNLQPVLVFGMCFSEGGAPVFTTESPALTATVTSGRMRAGYKIYNTSPFTHTLDMADLGTLNAVCAGYIRLS